MRRSICLASAITTFLSALAVPAVADDRAVVSSVKKTTVYATRSPRSTFDVPAMTSVIETDSAGNALANDTDDLLEFIPSVEVDGGPRRNGQTISIRGFDDEAIITLIDGRRQNFESAHDGRFFVDPSLLKSVEVVKGAASAIYGGGAVGGVVAFDTKDAADLLAPGETTGLMTSFGFRSATDDYAPSATGYMRTGNWDLLGNLTYRHADDIEQGGNNELIAKDHLLSGLFKAGYTLNDVHTFKIQFQTQRNDSTEPNNGQGAITATSNPLVNKEVRDNQYSFKYAFEDPTNNWLKPKLHVYFNDTSVEEADFTGTNNGRVQSRDLETLGVTLDNQTVFGAGSWLKQTLSYGFEYYTDEQTGSNTFTANGARAGVPDAEADNYGFYLQDEIALNTGIGDLLIIPAVRYDSYESNDNAGNSQDESRFSPKIAASYMPNDNLMLFGSWAQAFRAPNLTELYPAGQHFPGVSFCPALPFPGCPPVPLVVVFPNNFFIPNPDLRPETVTTFEFGAGVTFDGLLAASDMLEVKGSWHHSDGDDFITQEVNLAAGTTRNFNIANAELEGWEIDGNYAINGFAVRVGASHVTAINENTGEFLPNSIPHTLVSDISYTPPGSNSTFGIRGRFAEGNDEVPATETPTDGYSIYDLYYRWQKGKVGKENLVIDLGVENITDKAYTRRFAGLLEEGRSYGARIAYQW